MIYAKEFSVSSPRNFMILSLVFMYFIHVEFVFICGVRDNCFAYGCLSFPALLVEKPAFLHVCFCLCRRLIHREFGLTSGSSVPLTHVSGSVPIPHSFDSCNFVVYSKNQEGFTSNQFLFSPSKLLSQLEVFVVPHIFQHYSFQFCKNQHDYFNRICVKSVNGFGYCVQLNNINSSNPRAQGIFLFICIMLNLLHCCFIGCKIQVFQCLD